MAETAIIKKEPVPVAAGSRGLVLRSIDEMWRFSVVAFQSGIIPDGLKSKEQVFIALQMGLEVGLAPMAAVQSIAVINNKPCIWGDGALGVCRVHQQWDEAVFEEKIVGEGDAMTAYCTIGRTGGKPQTRSFSVAEAKAAKLSDKPIWKQYPRRMLQMRARAFAMRDTFADALKGLKIAEEVQDYIEPESGTPSRALSEDSAKLLNDRFGDSPPQDAEVVRPDTATAELVYADAPADELA